MFDQPGRQGSGVELVDHIFHFRLAEAARDDPLLVDAVFDIRGGYGDPVEQDTQGPVDILSGHIREEQSALVVQKKANRPSSHPVRGWEGLLQFPLFGRNPVQHRFIGLVTRQDVGFAAEGTDDGRSPFSVGCDPIIDILYLVPDVRRVRGVSGAFFPESFDVAGHLVHVHFRVSLRGENSIPQDAGAFEHSLEVFRIVESAPELTVRVECRYDVFEFLEAVGKLGLELLDLLVAFL